VTLSTAREAIAEMDERAPGWLGRSTLQRVSTGPGWSSLRPFALVEAAAARGRRVLQWVSGRPELSSLAPFGLVMAAAAALIAVVAPVIAAGGWGGAGASKPAAAAATPSPAPVRAPSPAGDVPSATAQPAAPVATGSVDAAPEAAPAAAPVPTAAPTPAAAPVPAAAPGPAAAPVQVAAKDAPQPPAPPAPARHPADLGTVHTVNIPRGGSILAAARELYGDRANDLDRSALLEQVRRLNPGLRDVNLVKAGAVVKFPPAPARSESDGQHPE